MAGTATGAWPAEGTKVMVAPYGACVGSVVPPRVHRNKTPAAVLLSYSAGMQADLRCASVSCVAAWGQVMPVSEGTVTGGGPVESTTLMVDPSLSDAPTLGLCEMMRPAATGIDWIRDEMSTVK